MKKLGLLLAVIVIIAGFNYYFSHIQVARISNVKLTTAMDAFNTPIRVVDNFKLTDKAMFISMLVHNAPKDTKMRIVWKQGASVLSETVNVVSESKYIGVQLKTEMPLAAGNYIIEVYINEKIDPEFIMSFKIVEN